MVDSGTADMAGILSALGILAKRRPILKRFTIECQSNRVRHEQVSAALPDRDEAFQFLSLTEHRGSRTLRKLNGFNHGPSRIAAQRERIGPLSFYEEVKE